MLPLFDLISREPTAPSASTALFSNRSGVKGMYHTNCLHVWITPVKLLHQKAVAASMLQGMAKIKSASFLGKIRITALFLFGHSFHVYRILRVWTLNVIFFCSSRCSS